MTVKIGYPDKWRDYSALEISQDNLFQNMINVGKFETKRAIDKAGNEVDRTEWYMNPHTVNAYFEPTANEIVFPAAILHSPFFDLHASAAQNFGGIGTVIGHEIGHCFDDQGAMFNELGVLTNWWTDDDLKNFKALTSKLVDQYNAYSPRNLDDSKHVIGELTLGENIGDLGGVQIALKALLNVVKPNNEAEKAEVLREFFTQYALSERIKRTKELTELLLGVDPHSPSEFRVNGVLRNVDAFYEAFGLEKGEKLWLDEDERITIW
jgi:putative endopeptidase